MYRNNSKYTYFVRVIHLINVLRFNNVLKIYFQPIFEEGLEPITKDTE